VERPAWPKGAISIEVTAWLRFSKKGTCDSIMYMCDIVHVHGSKQELLDEFKRWFFDGAEEL
jgi:hypothetical protein